MQTSSSISVIFYYEDRAALLLCRSRIWARFTLRAIISLPRPAGHAKPPRPTLSILLHWSQGRPRPIEFRTGGRKFKLTIQLHSHQVTRQVINELLDRVRFVQDQCDLDLLIFCFRHPHALLSSEHLAAAVGHDPKQVDASLDKLIHGSVLERTQNPRVAARMHAFRAAPDEQGQLASLLQMASSREGRLAIIKVLENRMSRSGAEARKRKA
jgi:hypothetical protein